MRLLDAIGPGSYLAITHATLDLDGEATEQAEAQQEWNKKADPITPRTHADIGRFFDGLQCLATRAYAGEQPVLDASDGFGVSVRW